MRPTRRRRRPLPRVAKAASGIRGLDEITNGGLPRGRPTLVCGAAGSGKTLLAMEFLVRGIEEHGEPGVFVSFEETSNDLAVNFGSLSFDLARLVAKKKLVVDYVHVERHEIEETGEYDLEGLFVRLAHAVEHVGAKRLVLDSVETLFSGLSNMAVLRAELRRLFHWIKDRGLTAVVTAERGERTLTRHGLEEYISDCVIVLDNRVEGQTATRRLRVVKYRGSVHDANEIPFLLDENGLSAMPVSALTLDFPVSSQRISTGVPGLDEMLGGRGYYRGSTILVSGAAGTGKTSLAASFAHATCAARQRCLYLALEESPQQLVRNMRSIGCDLEPWRAQGLLEIAASRPSLYGLEMRLLKAHQLVEQCRPSAVIIDPVSNLILGPIADTRSMLTRLVDFLKNKGITALFTSLTPGGPQAPEESQVEISSLIDTWILVRDLEAGGERNRALTIVKSRGMSHSNQMREFVLSRRGIEMVDIEREAGSAVTGSARLARDADEQKRRVQIERKRAALEAQIRALRAAFDVEAQGAEAGTAAAGETAPRAGPGHGSRNGASAYRRRRG
jgi:circadian clock protein KaiC